MIELKSRVHKVYVKRFKQKQSEPKYGSINKGFTELELQRFLRSVPNDKFRLLFKYQAFLGLRIGEVCKLQIGNIDFEKRELTIFSEKRQKPDSMIIPHELYLDTIEFIKSNMDAIKSSDEYLFFKDHGSHSKEVHIDVNYTRKIFRQAVLKAGLDSTYAYADETTRKIAYV
ncbi:MAG: tyrosine-type recombinase/integrase [Candidatus Marsarchaeota archaeon]|nr:tyrosine-type recombinase/integrase [Candidatus Marsarchaeota archaeon]